VTNRLAALPLVLIAVLAVALGACTPTPAAAPALTDPREIVTKGVTSLADVKTFEFTASFTGNVQVPQLGAFDLSTITLAGAVDVPNRKAKVAFDAPSLLGSKLDALVVGDTAYYRVAGALGAALHGSADQYTKVPVPTGGDDPAVVATDMTKLVSELQAGLAQLPSPLTKGANEKCGDLDCYHVSTVVTAAQLQALDPAAGAVDGDATVDLWTRTSDYRPARIGVSVSSAAMGTFGFALDLRYDVNVSVEAPSPDKIAP
jgi:hypothetical protein